VDAFAVLMAIRGQIDFDDLVAGAVAALEGDPRLRSRWQARFSHLCVDEFQDVDAAQLRLVRILAAPEDNLFVVGDDDQP
jgi:DNA helicase-2/ATP-dependent DNA helicase PcrA